MGSLEEVSFLTTSLSIEKHEYDLYCVVDIDNYHADEQADLQDVLPDVDVVDHVGPLQGHTHLNQWGLIIHFGSSFTMSIGMVNDF